MAFVYMMNNGHLSLEGALHWTPLAAAVHWKSSKMHDYGNPLACTCDQLHMS
jgi:hypothetical protein